MHGDMPTGDLNYGKITGTRQENNREYFHTLI
jgi:hypothetical protein